MDTSTSSVPVTPLSLAVDPLSDPVDEPAPAISDSSSQCCTAVSAALAEAMEEGETARAVNSILTPEELDAEASRRGEEIAKEAVKNFFRFASSSFAKQFPNNPDVKEARRILLKAVGSISEGELKAATASASALASASASALRCPAS